MSRTAVLWQPCYRIIPSIFPPIGLFDRVTDPKDLDAVLALESLTNPRVRQEVGQLDLVPAEERISGPGSAYIMAAFTHLNPEGSRFSDGSWGVYYAGMDLETAILETIFHAEERMRATSEAAQGLDMRVILADLEGTLEDVRGPSFIALQDPGTSYGAGWSRARQVKQEKGDGLLYDSVRRKGGECAAVYRPKVLSKAHQSKHLVYPWDGRRIDRMRVTEKVILPPP